MKNSQFSKLFFFLALFLFVGLTAVAGGVSMRSPNGKLKMKQNGERFELFFRNRPVMELLRLSMSPDTAAPRFINMEKTTRVKADYTLQAGKRLHCTNEANEYRMRCEDSNGKQFDVVFRLYNDGLAFRYELSHLSNAPLPPEQTLFRFPDLFRCWLQQWNEAYEGFFPAISSFPPKGGPRGTSLRYAYPALFQASSAGTFALVTEANIERRQSASCFYIDKQDAFFRVQPDTNDQPVSGSWHSPWRVVIVGSLADIVQSTLVTDASEPCALQDTSWIHPGVVSWIYWAYNHGSNDYNIIKKYVDLAVALHLPYVLIDAEWDEMKDGKTIVDAVKYATSHHIKPFIWYNSSVGWINGAPGPKFKLNKPEDREREFAWCEEIGVAGVKIDFFSGDNLLNMDYSIDLIEAAARHHLLVNFHGATIPRGWQRTYPNLLTTEAVYGAEWYNNVPTFTDRAARHNATLPFTRNVIGPMDYTPCTFSDSQHPHITTHAHELALTVLFESGLQHLADRPESYLSQPMQVQQFLSQLPATWDDTRFIDGYPGEYAVMARRKGNVWYVAGINGTDSLRQIPLDLGNIPRRAAQVLFFGDAEQPRAWHIQTLAPSQLPKSVACQPRGGFLLVFQ